MTVPSPLDKFKESFEGFWKSQSDVQNKKITRLNKELAVGIALLVIGVASTVFFGYVFVGLALVAAGCFLGTNAWKERKACKAELSPLDGVKDAFDKAKAHFTNPAQA